MYQKIKYLIILFGVISIAKGEDVSVTIYNQNLGVVREVREFDFPKGIGEVRCVDVASQIIPTSVSFISEQAVLLEQNYEYDLVDPFKLLHKFIDRDITITTADGQFRGTLLAGDNGIVLRVVDNTIRSISQDKIADIHFPELPEGLITRPTLMWMVDSKKAGKGKAELSYMTHGMSWEAEYVAVVDDKDKNIDLTGWVNITNSSGVTYTDATLKLMAGDVNIIQDERRKLRDLTGGFIAESSAPRQDFLEQSFYEYHMYTLQRPSTLSNNQVKQISLFPTAQASVTKEYRYSAQNGDNKVQVSLIFWNKKENGLGIPLPKGKVRVYKQGSDKSLEFVGEDKIDHAPANEKLTISTGNAFDIVAEKTLLEDKRPEYRYQITVRNHKKETIEVVLAESLYGNWEFVDGTTPGWEKKSAYNVEWKVTLKPEEEKKINYNVFYSNR